MECFVRGDESVLDQKFDIIKLKQEQNIINECSKKIIELLYGDNIKPVENNDLYLAMKALEDMCKAVGMYNDVLIQSLEDKKIITSEPQKYIESSINNAYSFIRILLQKQIRSCK